MGRRSSSRPGTVPTAAGHDAPFAQTFGGTVAVVEIRQAEHRMSHFVGIDPAGHITGAGPVFRLHRVSKRHHAIDGQWSNQAPFVRPDVVAASGEFRPGTGMNNEQGVDIAVAVIVILRKIDQRVGQNNCIFRQPLGVLGIAAEAAHAVGVVAIGLRCAFPSQGAGHVQGDDGQVTVRDFIVVIAQGAGSGSK